MNANLINILETCGLREREAKVYLATLELNESTVLPISKRAGIERTYCYDILANLGKWGLVSFYEKNGRRRYIAEDPKKIKDLLKSRLEGLDSALPELRSVFNQPSEKPKMRYFEGKEGIISIYEEILRSKPKQIDAIASPNDIEAYIGDYFQKYIKAVTSNKIKARELITNNGANAEYLRFFTQGIQETRIMPENIKIATDTMIFDNKLVMISYGNDIHAVMIESSSIVDTQKAMFEMIWGISKKI